MTQKNDSTEIQNMNDGSSNNPSYNRKHEVLWHENFLLGKSGCKDWPNKSISALNRIVKYIDNLIDNSNDENAAFHDILNSIISNENSALHDMLNEIKGAVKFLDYGDAGEIADQIVKKYENMDGIQESIRIIDQMMQHHDVSRYFNADQHDRLMLFAEFNGSKRGRYSREFDRILVTKSFRHLQYKTQIMVNSASDDQRTRLLHSLEVQRIAKTVSIQLDANSNLAQTIAIGHDVGHVPFGHAGERALSRCLSNGYFGEFTHALQSVKVLNYIEKHPIVKRYGFRGLGLSAEVLSGILKHDTDTFSKDVSSAAFRLQYNCPKVLGYYPRKEGEFDDSEHGKLTMGTLEAQIVYWADKIAYLGHDWEEFVNSNHIEKLLYDINDIWEKIGVADAIYTKIDDKRKIVNTREEVNKLEAIHNLMKHMNDIFANDEKLAELNPLKRIEKLGKDLDDSILELLAIRDKWIEDEEKVDCTLLSRFEYDMLFDYFRVARAFMHITKRTPQKYKECNDIIYIIYRFFKDSISQRTTPGLEDALIEETRKTIKDHDAKSTDSHLTDAQWIVNQSMENWKNANTPKHGWEEKSEAKYIFMNALVVKPDNKTLDSMTVIDNFKFQYYVRSKEVQHMTDQASQIIEKLFEYYLEFPEMLPEECLEEYFYLVEDQYEVYEERVTEYMIDVYLMNKNDNDIESCNNYQKNLETLQKLNDRIKKY